MQTLPLALGMVVPQAPPTVIVTGAAGRTGALVVEELLAMPAHVRALVRDPKNASANEALPSHPNLSLVECDLGADDAASVLGNVCEGAHGVIWCATGFTSDGQSLDVKGMADCSVALEAAGLAGARETPSVVMLSSAAVTRPAWDDAKKAQLVGAADIPIVRLNPGGILGKKCEAEDALRRSGLAYSIVRPTGLKDDWPRGRPIVSQGDVAVGRTAPGDLASVLVSALFEPAAVGKTFEMFTLAGYPAPREGLRDALAALPTDAEGPPPEAKVAATYDLLQQLLPGETQDATQLEMGRTYEQLDRGEVEARERGAAPTAREQAVASAALAGATNAPPARRRKFLGLF